MHTHASNHPVKDTDPSGRDSIVPQQHPGNYPCVRNDDSCTAGNTADEDWADLIADYVAGNLIPNQRYCKKRMRRGNLEKHSQ